MLRIFLIGNISSKNEYEDILVSSGFNVKKADSLDKVLQELSDKKADVLIIDKSMSSDSSFNVFQKASKNIPKIVISEIHSFKGFSPWMKEPLVYPLYAPGSKEIVYFVRRAYTEANLLHENTRLKNEFSSSKKELDFYQEVSRTLTSSLELSSILTKIMDKVKEMTKAEAWSVLLVDHETGELVFEKANRKKVKRDTEIQDEDRRRYCRVGCKGRLTCCGARCIEGRAFHRQDRQGNTFPDKISHVRADKDQ